MNLWNLNFWETGEYQVIQEHLDDYTKKKIQICPQRKSLFRALKETPYDTVKVCIFGQDPYPNPTHATGISFDIPVSIRRDNWPPTLVNLLKEYSDDLHYPEPSNGSLHSWCKEGVLLWNSIPSCIAYRSLSHSHWSEWSYLNKEILERLSDKGDVVFVFLGGRAKENIGYLKGEQKVLTYSHPSPRGTLNSKTPFLGSRMFTTVNGMLEKPINWYL